MKLTITWLDINQWLERLTALNMEDYIGEIQQICRFIGFSHIYWEAFNGSFHFISFLILKRLLQRLQGFSWYFFPFILGCSSIVCWKRYSNKQFSNYKCLKNLVFLRFSHENMSERIFKSIRDEIRWRYWPSPISFTNSAFLDCFSSNLLRL